MRAVTWSFKDLLHTVTKQVGAFTLFRRVFTVVLRINQY